MPKPKPRALIEKTLFGLAALSLILGFAALGVFEEISKDDRALLIIISSVGIITSLFGLICVHFIWDWLRKRNSQKVLSAWQKSVVTGSPAQIDSAHQLSEGALRILAMQLFARIGYRILNRDEDEGYVRMMNPRGSLELVCCKQQAAPLGIQQIYEFQMDVKHLGAVQGHLWAAGGFTDEAINVASQRTIVLADRQNIGQFIDTVNAHNSMLLE